MLNVTITPDKTIEERLYNKYLSNQKIHNNDCLAKTSMNLRHHNHYFNKISTLAVVKRGKACVALPIFVPKPHGLQNL